MEANTPVPSKPADRLTLILRVLVGLVLLAVLVGGIWCAWAYHVSPRAIRQPLPDHLHLRLQIINDGKPVNFAAEPFQTPYNKDFCDATLTKEPFHFHDGKDQFLHLHWQKLTGGLMLKHYGWDFIGGLDNILGYRFDQLPATPAVSVHGRVLPQPPAGAHYYVFTGDRNGFTERRWQDFLYRDLKSFLEDQPKTSWLDWLIPAVEAHAGHDHAEEERLVQVNRVIGNIVIFAQKDRPTDEQVKTRFDALEPLPESSCGG